jgi:hypothetical protein
VGVKVAKVAKVANDFGLATLGNLPHAFSVCPSVSRSPCVLVLVLWGFGDA